MRRLRQACCHVDFIWQTAVQEVPSSLWPSPVVRQVGRPSVSLLYYLLADLLLSFVRPAFALTTPPHPRLVGWNGHDPATQIQNNLQYSRDSRRPGRWWGRLQWTSGTIKVGVTVTITQMHCEILPNFEQISSIAVKLYHNIKTWQNVTLQCV